MKRPVTIRMVAERIFINPYLARADIRENRPIISNKAVAAKKKISIRSFFDDETGNSARTTLFGALQRYSRTGKKVTCSTFRERSPPGSLQFDAHFPTNLVLLWRGKLIWKATNIGGS